MCLAAWSLATCAAALPSVVVPHGGARAYAGLLATRIVQALASMQGKPLQPMGPHATAALGPGAAAAAAAASPEVDSLIKEVAETVSS